jgi:hypothetical protein
VLSLPTFFILHHDSALLPFGISSVTCLSTIHFVGHSRKPIYLTFETGLRLSDTDNTSALEASIQGDVNINTQKASTAQIHGITIEQLITSDKVSLFFSVVGNCSHVSWLLISQRPILIAEIPKAHHGFHQCVHRDA